MTQQALKHWRIDTDDNRIAWVAFDRADASTNTFSQDTLVELDHVLKALEADKPKGAVFYSAKPNGFIAGADINIIKQLRDADDAELMVRESQQVFNRLEELPFPTVAMIHGFCLGGGLEMALACDYRVAEQDSSKLGLPEVMLGVHPGWGGTVRLPKLIGPVEAMPLMLTGRTVDARKAKRLGLVDHAVPERQLRTAAETMLKERPSRDKGSWMKQLTSNPMLKKPIAWQMRKEVRGKARAEHYPAPYAIIDLWEDAPASQSAQLAREAASFAKLAQTETSKNLVRVFFLQERLKGFGRGKDFTPKRVHVIGAGTMGGDIAAWCASKGMTVTLQDREAKYIAPAIKRASQLFEKKIRDKRKVTATLDRLIPDVEGNGAANADVIIEAIFENLEAKQALFKELEAKAKPDAVLASNTSSIPLDEIASVMKQPERLVGIHFFNPVAKMQLVEVVRQDKGDEDPVTRANAFVTAIGRLPLPVKSAPGFLVNRVLTPYLMEAFTLVEEGVEPAVIDEAAERYGMPMGPIELADTVGLDICLHVGQILAAHLGGDGATPARLKQLVDQKHLGRKTGRGFYEYDDGKPKKPEAETDKFDMQDITDRLVFRLINEGVATLREGVVEDADLLDAGMIFGTGFAPFRGGPANVVRTLGKSKAKQTLQQLQKTHGDRFAPDKGWSKLKL